MSRTKSMTLAEVEKKAKARKLHMFDAMRVKGSWIVTTYKYDGSEVVEIEASLDKAFSKIFEKKKGSK